MIGYSFPIRGNVVRLTYTDTNYACNAFFELMWGEGSAISQMSDDGRMKQIPRIYYWRGANITLGLKNAEETVIELQKDGKMSDLEELIRVLQQTMNVKFKRQTRSRTDK